MGTVDDDTIATNHKKALDFIEEVTTNTDEVQKLVLSEILSISSHVEYLQRHGLNGLTDRESYKNVIPVATYEDLKPYIERIANGDTSPILYGRPITYFNLSSGTSGGERKLFPGIEEEMERTWLAASLVMPVVNKFITGMDKGKAMFFLFSKENAYTPGGLPFCSVLTRMSQSSQFKNRPYDPFEVYTSPVETILCVDFDQSTYSQVLCGLYQSKQVVRLGCVFVYGLLRIILFIQKHWSLLCNDIRTGTINSQIITDVSVREAVKKILVKPDPDLADYIEIECKRDESWKGIISRLWPNAKCINAIITGSMSQHIPSVDFYSNGLQLVSPSYACSESFLGINLNPLCKPNEVAYTFIPNMAYFEFLPILHENQQKNHNQQEQHDGQELVDLANVKLGHEYEVFVTTYTGLYRYGIGDVLRVVGFKNTAPQFQYIRRKKILLSIDCEKTNEVELDKGVQNAMKHLMSKFNISLVDYTSYADTTSTSNHGHYVIYWELRPHSFNANNSGIIIPKSVFEECCFKIEESLSSEYKENRSLDKSIEPLEIKMLEFISCLRQFMHEQQDLGYSW